MSRFSNDCMLFSGTPEERTLIALSMLEPTPPIEYYDALFSSHLNWPWIIMQAMQHRVICIMWENIKRLNLMTPVIRSGLTKNWITYAEQLYRASLKKNLLWLECLERTLYQVEQAGIPCVCIKGSALIGDIYHPGNRMLGDIDTLVPHESRGAITDVLCGLGYQQGTIDPVNLTVKPLSREQRRFWSLNSHLIPKFNLETGDPDVPFLRLAVGFDFFDPHDQYSVPSDTVLEQRVARSGSHISVPDQADTVINLCAHIYREGVSATFGFAGDNWHLWKFCDLRTYLLAHNSLALRQKVARRISELGLQKPFYFALYYTQQVYGDLELASWTELCDIPEDRGFLHEMIDGRRRVAYRRAFSERLFDLRQTVVPGLEPVWAKVMKDGEWW
jgi:hypothetical protein